MRLPALLLVLLSVSACSSADPGADGPTDALSQGFIRAAREVPAFAGVALDGDRPVVFTRGDVSAAEPAVRAIFGPAADVRARPERGRGSESLKDAVSRAVFGSVPGAHLVDYDETTGYVVLGVDDAASVRESYEAMRSARIPTDEVVVQLMNRFTTLPG